MSKVPRRQFSNRKRNKKDRAKKRVFLDSPYCKIEKLP